MKKLMKLSVFRKEYFVKGSAPQEATLRRWIDSGELPGTRIGKSYYVDVKKLDLTGNSLVDQVLLAS